MLFMTIVWISNLQYTLLVRGLNAFLVSNHLTDISIFIKYSACWHIFTVQLDMSLKAEVLYHRPKKQNRMTNEETNYFSHFTISKELSIINR